MIARISGKVAEIHDSCVLVDVGGMSYQILIPPTVMQRLKDAMRPDGRVELVTYHYHQLEPSRSTPVLIGFLNDIEREFFEVFITVSGIGPRAAVRAFVKPISHIARAIDEGNTSFLCSLPGIGQQRAKEIIAKLQHKVGKFGLIQDAGTPAQPGISRDIEDEALAVLTQLEYKKAEAVAMIRSALERVKGIQSTEELLNEVYKQRKAR